MRWLLLLISSGCASPVSPFHGDVTFTAIERAAIERGAAFTAEHTGAPLDIVWDAPHVPDGTCRVGTIERSEGTGALAERGLGCIHIGVTQPEYIAVLAAHELGHWRGLEHVTHGLMQPVVTPTLAWSEEDQAECVRVGRCEPH